MRFSVLVLAFGLRAVAAVPVEIAHVVGQATALNTAITTAAVNTTGASIIFAIIAGTSNIDIAGATIADSAGNTWIRLTSQFQSTSVSTQICYAYKHGASALATSATHTVTVTPSGAQATGVIFAAWSGTLTSSDPYDAVQGGAHSLAVASLATGNITPAGNGRLIISGLSCRASITYTSSPIAAIATGDWVSSSPTFKVGIGYAAIVQGNVVPAGTTWAMAGSGDMAVAIAAFKPATTPATFTSIRRSYGQ